MTKAKERFGMGVSCLSIRKRSRMGKGRCWVHCKRCSKRKGENKSGMRRKVSFCSVIRKAVLTDLLKAGVAKMIDKKVMKTSKIAMVSTRKHLKSTGGK